MEEAKLTYIKVQRVVIRSKRPDDAREDYSWRTDAELAELDAALPLRISYEDFLRFYAEVTEYPLPWSQRFGVDTLEGKHIGNCMYYDIDMNRGQTELGIMIGDRDYWSKGYGTEVVNSLVNHIFSTTSFKRIYLHTLEWNIRAQRCFEKCDFSPLRTVNRGGKNFLLMEQLRSTWEARQAHNRRSIDPVDLPTTP
jgi:RimJ/RimL family protein N-acetyltransferase